MIRPVLDRIGEATDRYSEQAGCCRRPMQRMPEDSNDSQDSPRTERYDKPIAN